ncbi:antitoxin VapB family protein [Saccharolobus shibatae]|uniref:Putative antitoxin J5U23_01971 n=2 Tax=Saccharolobus shibatae TaxID=2286 RepID=A0A8F5GU73_SACSH|nr:antitoxin VapB family protein [Saccharolobus shibatae]QXJ29102.1 VapB protein (antitoxin to VapC) [Saccharolobus shibatae B12]QXJ32341.1 VapB protein (antitoxin to VapC) [Saccharolobus shibatae]
MCLNLRLNTAKTITISEEAYRLLLKEKRNGESFSDVIVKLIKGNRRKVMKYAGIWSDMNDEETNKLFKDLEKIWVR